MLQSVARRLLRGCQLAAHLVAAVAALKHRHSRFAPTGARHQAHKRRLPEARDTKDCATEVLLRCLAARAAVLSCLALCRLHCGLAALSLLAQLAPRPSQMPLARALLRREHRQSSELEPQRQHRHPPTATYAWVLADAALVLDVS